MKFHNPYQFIPVDTQHPNKLQWNEEQPLKRTDNHFARHDVWSKNSYSGKLTVNLSCLSPLVVGAQQTKSTKDKAGFISNYTDNKGNIALPGNSLRGMINSIAETISQSSLKVLGRVNDTHYSYREKTSEARKSIGLLLKAPDGQFEILELDNSISIPMSKKNGSCYQHTDNHNLIKHDGVTGIIYARGQSTLQKQRHQTKKSCRFIAWDGDTSGETFRVSNEVIHSLEQLLRDQYELNNDNTDQLPIGYNRNWASDQPLVQDGDLVYYKKSGNTVSKISYSAIWRAEAPGNLATAFAKHSGKDSLPWNIERDQLTPAEQLFGVIEEPNNKHQAARNLASRVRFSDAHNLTATTLLPKRILKILDSPKPPSPAMYFSAHNGAYISKKQLNLSKHQPNGRKHYLPHRKQNSILWYLTEQEKEEISSFKQYHEVEAIDEGNQFHFNIHFENLSNAELSLLCKTIQPSEQSFVHRLGMGKPRGLGQVQLNIDTLEIINRQQRYQPEDLIDGQRYQAMNIPNENTLIDLKALESLCHLQNPDNLEAVVAYPFIGTDNDHAKSDSYEWFVENDKKPKHQSQYIEQMTLAKPLPTLKS